MMGLLIGLAVLSLFALILALAAWRLGEGMKESYSDDCSANDPLWRRPVSGQKKRSRGAMARGGLAAGEGQ